MDFPTPRVRIIRDDFLFAVDRQRHHFFGLKRAGLVQVDHAHRELLSILNLEKVELAITRFQEELLFELSHENKGIGHLELSVAAIVSPEAEHNKLWLSLATFFSGVGVRGLDILRLAVVALRKCLHALWHVEALVVRVHLGLPLKAPADMILRVALGAVLGAIIIAWTDPFSLLLDDDFLAKAAINLGLVSFWHLFKLFEHKLFSVVRDVEGQLRICV